MKNLKYFPFERNRYYYGKLLTEQDFNSEQKYLNDKRRMGNRFLHGIGVVCGLNIVALDENSISIEPGFALDGVGREIVVDRPRILRLEDIKGFENITEYTDKEHVYLCIEYNETEAVPSHNVAAGASVQTGEVEYDKWMEGYRLYITDRPLKNQEDTVYGLFSEASVIYEDRDIRITQKLPKYVKSGEEFTLTICAENKGSAKECQLSFIEKLNCAEYASENVFKFNETLRFEKRDSVKEFDFKLKAFQVEMGNIQLTLAADSFAFVSGQKKSSIERDMSFKISVENEHLGYTIAKRHFEESMNKALHNSYPEGIYLAKLSLIQTGSVYMIDKVENIPFEQYVYHPLLLMGLIKRLYDERKNDDNTDRLRPDARISEEKHKAKRYAEGIAEIELGVGGKRGQRFFSHEIIHGLGLGRVDISLSLVEDKDILFGSSEIFEDFKIKAELAAKADITRGGFVIGIRLLEPTGQQTVKVQWRAELLEEDKEGDNEPHLAIKPDKIELKVRESCYLNTVGRNIDGTDILWEVKSPLGGEISRDGRYTAPNQPGVYEVSAICQEMPSVRASIYVIVRE